MEALFRFEHNLYSTVKDEIMSMKLLTKWTNLKATLAGASSDGNIYQDYHHFTTKELLQHIGIYIIHGISPSPRVEHKFKPKHVDSVHGNDMVYYSFGTNSERHHRHFKCFFACQNPAIIIPCRTKYPSWKVRPLITWMNYIYPCA